MKKISNRLMFVLPVVLLIILTACAPPPSYSKISAEEAKEMMDKERDYVILDVRTPAEYEAGYVPGAVSLPNETIGKSEIAELPDKDQLIFVYCQSGNRSRQAAGKLIDLGYTRVYDFGGISDWPYELERRME